MWKKKGTMRIGQIASFSMMRGRVVARSYIRQPMVARSSSFSYCIPTFLFFDIYEAASFAASDPEGQPGR